MSYSQRYIQQQQKQVKQSLRTVPAVGAPPVAVRQNDAVAISKHIIEPELLTATLRRFRWTASSLKFWFGIVGYLAFVATVVGILWPLIRAEIILVFLLFLLTGTPLLALHACALQILRLVALLQGGIAATAVVTKEAKLAGRKNQPSEEDMVRFTYTFKTKDGNIIKGTEVMVRNRAWQLEIGVGSEFTVLYDPAKPGKYRPYFLFTEAEIPGGMGPNITAP